MSTRDSDEQVSLVPSMIPKSGHPPPELERKVPDGTSQASDGTEQTKGHRSLRAMRGRPACLWAPGTKCRRTSEQNPAIAAVTARRRRLRWEMREWLETVDECKAK